MLMRFPGMALDPIFVYGNYVESCVWAGIGVVALVKRNSRWSLLLGVTLIVFGISDIVEAHTGAWYDPWWLFVWKALCVLLVLVSGFRVLRIRRQRQATAE